MSVDFDPTRIERLKQLLGAGFPAMAESFQTHLALSLAELRMNLDQNQIVEARAIAHRIRSSASQFGLMNLAEAAERFERHETGEEIRLLWTKIEQNHRLIEPILTPWLQGDMA